MVQPLLGYQIGQVPRPADLFCYNLRVLSISLLGTPALTLGGNPLPVTRRKSRAILYYLAAHDGPLTRDHLLAFFWPDLERAAAQQTLRTTLHGLRKTLGEHLIVEDENLALTPGANIDVRLFAASLQPPISSLQSPASSLQPPASNLQTLVSNLQLYRGDFLSGFTLPDTPAFDDWAAIEREHYRRLAVRGLTALAELHEAGGNFTAALDALERALAFDSLQEDLQRAAMRLHYLAGDRAAAIRRYDSLRKLLDEEMGVPPMAETRKLYDEIIGDKLAAGNSNLQKPKITTPSLQFSDLPITNYQLPFIGRESELQTLRAALSARRLVLIEGEPGIGKTRLAEEFVAAANALTLAGGARELESALPYQPIIESLRSLTARADWPALRAALRASLPPVWLAEAARLMPELDPAAAPRPTAAPVDESKLWEGVHQLLAALAAQRPAIVFIDDLQWADSASLALLGYLVRQPSPSIAYLAVARAVAPRSPLAALLQTLTREDRLTRLALGRLTPADIARLVQDICATNRETFADWLARSSEGNPYVLVELIRYAREKSILAPDGAVNRHALAGSPIVPQSVYALTQARLDRLSDPARRMLDAAVAAGRDFDFQIVYRAAGLSEPAALDALDELRAANLVHPNRDDPAGRLHTFDHSVTLEVAYREIAEARHRHLHRRVAEAMQTVHGKRLESVAGLIASHFSEGGDAERAAPHAIRAGKQALNLAAWKEAIEFFAMALAAELEAGEKYEITLLAAEACFRSGESARASEMFRAALALARPGTLEAANARLALARSFLTQNRFAEVIEHARTVERLTPVVAAQAEFLWGTALSIEGADLAAAAEHLHRGESLLNQSGAPADLLSLAQIKFELGSVAAQLGDLTQAVDLYRASLDIAEEIPGESAAPQRILALNNLGYHLHLLGDPTATSHARRGLALAQESGILPLQPFLHSTLGEIALAANDLDSADRHLSAGLALAERLDIPERIAGLTANLGRLALARGQTDLAIHRLSTALARADSLGTRHLAAQIRIWLAPLLPAAEARAALTEARSLAEGSGRKRLLAEVAGVEQRLGL